MWSDDLCRTAGRSWMRVAEDIVQLRAFGEAYVLCWSNDDDDHDDETTR
jgi:hypothetical protein